MARKIKSDHAVYREVGKSTDPVFTGTKARCMKELDMRAKAAERAGCHVERCPERDGIEIGNGSFVAHQIRDVSFCLYVAPWMG